MEGENDLKQNGGFVDDDLPELTRQAFIVRIWSDSRDSFGRGIWRGRITHVLTGEQVHIQYLEDLIEYFERYLASKGG